MTRLIALLALGLAACGGNKTPIDTGGDPFLDEECDQELSTSDVNDVPSTEWPVGLEQAIEFFPNLSGIWAGDCGGDVGEVSFKVTAPVGSDDIEIITGGVADKGACGCVSDPAYDPDNALDPIAVVHGSTVFFTGYGDPGIDDRLLDADMMVFGAESPLLMRMCVEFSIDPYLGSEFDSGSVMIYIDRDGLVGGASAVLSNEHGTWFCTPETLTQTSR